MGGRSKAEQKDLTKISNDTTVGNIGLTGQDFVDATTNISTALSNIGTTAFSAFAQGVGERADANARSSQALSQSIGQSAGFISAAQSSVARSQAEAFTNVAGSQAAAFSHVAGSAFENLSDAQESAFHSVSQTAQSNADAAGDIAEQFSIGANNLSGALASGFTALSNISSDLTDASTALSASGASAIETGFEATNNRASGSIAQVAENNFGGFNISKAALFLGIAASVITLWRFTK